MQARSRIWSVLLIGNLLLTLALLGQGVLAQTDTPPTEAPAAVLGAAFTYQGQLSGTGGAINANCDLQFSLFDAQTGGAQVGSTQTHSNVAVANGRFTVALDFGATVFNGQARYLQIGVRCPAGSGTFTTLLPRQSLTAVPYATYATSAPWSGLSGVPAGFADGTDNTGPSYTAGPGLVLNGSEFSAKGSPYANVVTVAASGGNFTKIQDALNSITDNSASKRYLVWVAPGTYSERVTMKPYVDIEGAGEGLTTITSGAVNTITSSSGTVNTANNAELRFLTVSNTGDGLYGIAILSNSGSPRITHVTATVTAAENNYAVYNQTSATPLLQHVTAIATSDSIRSSYALLNDNASPTVIDSTLVATGGSYSYAIFNSNAAPTLLNVTGRASGATSNYGLNSLTSSATLTNVTLAASGGTASYGIYVESGPGTITIHRSTISGATNGIYNAASSTVQVGASQLSGTNSSGGGTLTCAASYKANFTALSASCG